MTVHSPEGFRPEDYRYVGCFYTGPNEEMASVYDDGDYFDLVEQLKSSPTSRWWDRAACDHCGHRISYVAVMVHTPTGDHIALGFQCLDNRWQGISNADFKALKKEAEDLRAKRLVLARIAEFLSEHPEAETIAKYQGENVFVSDLARKFRMYGQLSERQLIKGLEAIERDAEREALPPEPTVDAPSGKVRIEGEVLTVKVQEGFYGDQLKMLVKIEEPQGFWKLWVTVPTSIQTQYRKLWDDKSIEVQGVERGDRVAFTATVEPSQKDSTFAFGKRPTKAEIIQHQEAA